MNDFKFNLQRFAATITDGQVTIPAGETFSLDGMTYTAGTNGAVLNATTTESDGTFTATAVTGIASGSATATASGSDAKINLDATDGAINFTATSDGSVIAARMVIPFEFISGEYTFDGTTLAISAGSKFAIVDTKDGYSLRNENTFVYDGTYTFSGASITSDCERVISVFTLTNGSDTRTLNLEQHGSVVNNFLERGFTLLKGSSEVAHIGGYTLTATATDDAALNLALDANGLTLVPTRGDGTLNITMTRGDTTVLAGELECTSGEITFGYDDKVTFAKDTSFSFTQGDYVFTATTTDTASASVSLTDDGFTFTPGENDGGLNVVLIRGGTPVFGGELNVSGGTISFDPTTQKVSFTEGTEVSIAIGGSNPQEFAFKVTGGDASFKAVADGAGNFVITPDEGDGSLDITLKQGGQTVFYNNISISGGSIIIGNMGQTIGLTAGTTVNVTLGNYTITATADADASFQLDIQSDGSIAITPNSGDGALDIVINRGDTPIFANTFSVNNGTIKFNPTTQAITLTDGTEVSVSFGDYELVATANGDATSVMTLTGSGIEIKPNTGDGTLNLTLSGTSAGSLSADIKVISGSFILGQGGALTVTKGTELQIDFGNGYIVNFKATDDAGGSLSLGADGITFKPNSDDGGLELSITRDGETRTTNLNVTGSVTYKLDGTLSLAQGTVISNTWEDGAALKITATNDGVSNVRFDPETGLTVTDADNNLELKLIQPNDGVVDIDSITGSLAYRSGAVTLSEGTNLHMTNNSIEQVISVDSGTLVVDFTEMDDDPEVSLVSYSVSDNSRSVIKSVNVDKALICTGGKFKSGKNIQLLLPGSNIYGAAGDSGVGATTFSLDGDGEYNVNGIKVTVSNIDLHDKNHYGTAIRLIDNKSIAFNPGTANIAYEGMNFTGDGIVYLSEDGVRLGDGVIATGFDVGETVILYEKGSVTVDGKIFELTDNAPTGISVTGTANGFVMSSLDDGKIFTENFGTNDDNYRVQLNSGGLQKIIGISDGATVTGGATYDGQPDSQAFYFVTDTEGTFNVGKKPYVIGGSASVAVRTHFDDSLAAANGFDNLNGTVSGDFTAFPTSINGGNVPIKILGDTDVSISADSDGLEIYDLSDGANLADTGGAKKAHTDTTGAFVFGEGVGDSIGVTVQNDPNVTFVFDTDTQIITNINDIEGNLIFSETSHMCTINGIGGVFGGNFASVGATADMLRLYEVADGSSLVTGDADKIWLQERGNFKLNDNELTLTGDADGIWLRDKEVVGLDEGASLTVSEAGNYTVNGQSLTAKAGDTFVGLDDGNDAYIYDENNQLLTKNTPTERIVAMFPNANEVSIVGASATGQVPVSLSGGDLAVVESTNAKVSISAGDADTVVSKGGNVELNLRGGKTDIFPLDGRMSLTGNYDPSNATGFGTTYANVMTALQNGQLAYSNGELKIDSAQVYFGTNGELVNIFDRVGKLQKVGFAEHDASINAGNATDNLILSGGDYATLISGSGNDTILAAEGSSIDAGDGSNFIELASSRDTLKAGTIINVDKGNNTVTNFRAGFGYNADFVAKSDDSWDSSFDGTNVSIKTDSGTTVLQSVGSGEAFAKVKTYEAGIEYSVAIVQKNSVMTGGDIANIYVGDYSGVDFTGFNGLLLANLHEESAGRAVDQAICFYGVNSLTAGDGQNTLSGSEYVETLSGGKGDSSLWTDAGNDVMIGGDGYDEFFFLANDGRDVVKNFDFDKDAINIMTNEATAASVDSSGNVILTINHSEDDLLTIENAAGKNFRINNLVMNVDKNILYNDAANCFVATGTDATLTVTDSAEIWMDNTHGKFYVGDIKTIDATTATGETKLAGNELDNTILAGNGDTSLWGGNGGNDVLIGGFGRNVFFYATGNGSDEVVGTNDGDVVELTGLTLEQISSSEITSDGVTLNFVDGGKLFVNGTNAVDFRINGETYAANHDNGQWTKK